MDPRVYLENLHKRGKSFEPISFKQKTTELRDLIATGEDPGNAQDLLNQAYEQQYGTETFDQEQFDTLLNKLTGSKMKQQRQKSVEGRRDIYAGGLANMMRNF